MMKKRHNKANSFTLGLYGGLGNQMFQYAFARKLSIKKNAPLILDLYGFEYDSYYKRDFDLGNFNIKYDEICSKQPLKFHFSRFIYKFPCFIWSKLFKFLLVENNFFYYFDNTKINYKSYIFGYWQNETYFSEIKEVIKDDFKLITKMSVTNTKLLKKISQNPNSVSIHVRRMHGLSSSGSLKDDQTSKNSTLSIDYYRKAVALMLAKLPQAKFYIFSDNPKWTKKNLKFLSNAIFLKNDRGRDFEDIVLMSKCYHHIIANSSFSWWGAWLGHNSKKVVIAPPKLLYSPDIPDNWIILS